MNAKHPQEPFALEIRGPLTAARAAHWQSELDGCIKPSGEVSVDLRRIDSMDTIGAQLLVSACKTADRRGAAIRFGETPRCVADAFAAIGVPALPFQLLRPISQ